MARTHHHTDYSEDDPSGNFEQSTPFPYDSLDGEGADQPMTEQQLAVHALSQMLEWFLGFCFYSRSGKSKPISVAFKRLIAMTYILRPDLLGGATLDDITAELGESRNALSRWTAELTYMFGEKGINQQLLEKKVRHHFAALAQFDKTRHTRPVTIEEWIMSTPPKSGPDRGIVEPD